MRLFIAGDSIMAPYTIHHYPLTGIGMVLGLYLDETVTVRNFARPGRSTKSYIAQGVLEELKQELVAGDWLIICFGHNDEKKFDDYLYTDPCGAFEDNLRSMIALARAAGATPVLVTPLERRLFMDASDSWRDPDMDPKTAYTLRPSAHAEYAEAMERVARQEQVGLIDLLTASRRMLTEAGPVASSKWYMNLGPGEYPAYPQGLLDNTHLTHAGAVTFAAVVAQGLKELEPAFMTVYDKEG